MNLDKFKTANFKRRTAVVQVPALSDFFDDGVPAEFVVQNLTGEEVAIARERIKQNSAISEIVEKIVGEKVGDKIEGIKEALGMSDNVPDDLVYRHAVAQFGIQSPSLDQSDCVRLAKYYPETFYALTSKIFALTGLGSQPGE